MKKQNSAQTPLNKQGFWEKLSLVFLKYWPVTLLVWLAGLCFGIHIYTQAIARDGFPTINTPIALVTATYFSADAQDVDQKVAKPLNQILGNVEGVTQIKTTSTTNGLTALVNFETGSDNQTNNSRITQAIANNKKQLPVDLQPQVVILRPAGYLGQYDLLVSVYDRSGQSDLKTTQQVADFVAEKLALEEDFKKVETIPLLMIDNQTGKERQIGFNQIGLLANDNPEQDQINFYDAVHVGVTRYEDKLDVLGLSEVVERRLENINRTFLGGDFDSLIIEDLSVEIDRNIHSLESNLLTALLVISLITFLLISWRSAIVVAIFTLSVLATAITGLYLIGYTLNLITLFALILALGLLVDDAVIMVESLDSSKDGKLPLRRVVKTALEKILLASLAGTLTTVLVFIPLAFVEGVLGEFIRLIPVTLTLILLISFFFSITLIPVLAKFSILKEKEPDIFRRFNPLLKLEDRLGKMIAKLPLLLQTKPRLGKQVMAFILIISFAFIGLSFSLFSQTEVNIFPSIKDSDNISYSVEFPDTYSLEQAESVSQQMNQVLTTTLSGGLAQVNYTSRAIPDQKRLLVSLNLKPLSERKTYSPVLVERLQNALDQSVPQGVNVFVAQNDNGPPDIQYPFSMPIDADDEATARRLAEDIKVYLTGASAPVLYQTNGEIITFQHARARPDPDQITRLEDHQIIDLEVQYSQVSVSDSILNDTETLIKEHFNADYLTLNGYDPNILAIEIPQTSLEESFDSLNYIFPLAMVLIYALLWWQFKSWLQPFIILIALPFALAGVFSWLYYTQTPFSFIVTVGLISLIGIAINNSILLVSYANAAQQKI